ncbi:MAG: aminopeptidase N [Actinobacteria bacterium]|nr:aminopeptidase N [Actinomycetota bacterium]
MSPLTRTEAQQRATTIRVSRMVVALDLDQGPETFGSRAEIHFEATAPETFVDLRPVGVARLELNGQNLDPAALVDGRLALTGLEPSNVLIVEATMAYSRDGQGLHRSVDPADEEAYVYGHLFLDAAPTVFACFDQPDIKAPYAVSVRAPADWRVLGNGAATRVAEGCWELAETPPLATYFVTVCAGPWASVEREHDGIRLGVHSRRSLSEALERQADSLLNATADFFDYYHELFGIRYPFGDYHQVFCPEFNAGAMENPGCVTIRDTYLFRGSATHDELLTRTNTIAHEMAHMWFGDLVTMTWWDDLWLNESFAEYLAHRACVAASEYADAWVDSTMARKLWGHSAERSPSSHPVAGSPAQDAQTALNNFDGISYAKGSAVLRQLIAHIGDDAFVAGLRDHLQRNSFGNADLAGFLAAIERESGSDLSGWSHAWLETAGIDTLHVHQDTGRVTRSTPDRFAKVSRPHTFDIAGFTSGTAVFRVTGTIDRATRKWPELLAADRAEVVIPNASDLTWAVSGLEPESLANLPDALASIPDAQSRAVAWLALIDGMHEARIDPRLLMRTLTMAWPLESNGSILGRVGNHVITRAIPVFLPPAEQPGGEEAMATAARRLYDGATSADHRLIAARLLAATSGDETLLRSWLDGIDLPPELVDDSDFRWFVVRAMSRRGLLDEQGIESFRRRDESLAGQQAALAARALRPTAEAKEWAWSELTGNPARSNYELNALAGAFWQTTDRDLVSPYVERYFTDVPGLAGRLGEDALGTVAALAYPLPLVASRTLDLSRAALARDTLSPAVRRSIVDAQAKLEEGLASRAAFPATG